MSPEPEAEPSVAEGTEGDEGLSEEELEELRLKAAAQASKDLVAYARTNHSAAALLCCETATRVDWCERGSPDWSALHYAALHGDTPLLDRLLALNAHQGYLTANDKRTRRELKEQLATSGSSVTQSNGELEHDAFDETEDGHLLMNTPLHWSCFKGHMPTTLSLLDAGYSLKDLDKVGNTPLHLAGASRNLAVVELLLSSGADPTAKNAFHLTPLEVTTAEDVREVLRRAMTRAAAQTPSSSSSSAALMVSAQHQAAAQQARDVERKALSLSLRTAANRLKDALQQPLPSTLEEEAARLVELEAVRAAAIATNGLVDQKIIDDASTQMALFELSSSMRNHLAATQEQHPVVTQAAYIQYVNKLERYAKVVEAKGGDGTLVANAKQEIAQSFAEFWLFKIETELNAVPCASPALQGRIDLLEERLTAATAQGGAESLLTSSSALLERFKSEVALTVQLESVPSYTMPPPEEEIAELNKKQLAAFLAEHWKEDDTGYIKETTEADGCQPFPLPPGFGKADDDEEWANNPMKALINTPEGYIWIPSKALLALRTATKALDEAHAKAANLQAFPALCEQGQAKLTQLSADVAQLELKDETDMAMAEAAAAKASKKMKAALKKGGKKK